MEKQAVTNGISRRSFLKRGGGITFMIAAIGIPGVMVATKNGSMQLTAWVHLDADGTLTIYNPASEMGQGTMTALPAIFAEEMDADWTKVKIENAPVEPETYGIGWGGERGGSMLTVGSRSVSGHFQNLRQAGAQARYILLENVADKWGVKRSELETDSGLVTHKGTGKRIAYGEIVKFAKIPEHIPEIPDSELKNPKDFKLIGKTFQRYDIPSKVDGTALFSGDVHIENMVYGMVKRSPVNGTRPELKNRGEIESMKGVLEIVPLDYGIGVVAQSIETALKAKERLEIDWIGEVEASHHNSESAYSAYEEMAKSDHTGNIISQAGDMGSEILRASRIIQADYKNDYIYHAQMEPLNAVAHIKENSAEVWVGTQAADGTRSAIADHLGIDFQSVNLHTYYLGGGFGRRSMTDYVLEAVDLSKAVKLPVKLQWTREDDIQYGAFRPISLQKLEAGIDHTGKINAWKHLVIGTGGGLLGSGADIPFYDIPNKHIEVRNIDHGVRTKHWRAVGHGPNKFAIETFMDEVAGELKQDAYQLRRDLMKNHPRALKVLDTAAEMANWGSPVPEDRGMGMGFAERSGSLAAGVCEISVDKNTGKIKVHRIWASLDAGTVVHPANAKYQMEGALVMGLSSVLMESITFKNGKVEQSNFHNYPILRMEDAPEHIEIEIVPSSEKPTGIGEAGLPFMGALVSNAFANLTGKRLRHMPFTPEKVLAVLKQ